MNRRSRWALPVIFAFSTFLVAQMPDWKYFRDREGNTYFFDQAGKIRITSMKQYRYRAVSPRGIDYYLEYGTELINEHHPIEGLSVLKSICALKNDNNRIYQAQVKAADLIMKLKKRNGPRFTSMNESASLMIYTVDDGIEIINDQMMYSFKVPGRVDVVRKVDRGGWSTDIPASFSACCRHGGRMTAERQRPMIFWLRSIRKNSLFPTRIFPRLWKNGGEPSDMKA